MFIHPPLPQCFWLHEAQTMVRANSDQTSDHPDSVFTRAMRNPDHGLSFWGGKTEFGVLVVGVGVDQELSECCWEDIEYRPYWVLQYCGKLCILLGSPLEVSDLHTSTLPHFQLLLSLKRYGDYAWWLLGFEHSHAMSVLTQTRGDLSEARLLHALNIARLEEWHPTNPKSMIWKTVGHQKEEGAKPSLKGQAPSVKAYHKWGPAECLQETADFHWLSMGLLRSLLDMRMLWALTAFKDAPNPKFVQNLFWLFFQGSNQGNPTLSENRQ